MDEAASLKKQQAEDRQQNSKVTAAATKIHNHLDKTFQEHKKTVELSKEHEDSLPNALVIDLSADFEKVQKALAESAAAIKQSATVATKGGRLNDLSHDFKEIVLLSNDFKNGARQAKVIMKALKLCK